MPIVLIDSKPKSLAFGDASITYVEASGDRILAELRRGARRLSSEPSETDAVAMDAAVRLCAEQVVNWSGFVDVAGTPVPWPAEGRVAPETDAVTIRAGLLRALPWNVLAALDAAVAKGWHEGTDSGKGSGSGSNG